MKDIGIITKKLSETIQPSFDDCIGLGLSRRPPVKKEMIKRVIQLFYLTCNDIICISINQPVNYYNPAFWLAELLTVYSNSEQWGENSRFPEVSKVSLK